MQARRRGRISQTRIGLQHGATYHRSGYSHRNISHLNICHWRDSFRHSNFRRHFGFRLRTAGTATRGLRLFLGGNRGFRNRGFSRCRTLIRLHHRRNFHGALLRERGLAGFVAAAAGMSAAAAVDLLPRGARVRVGFFTSTAAGASTVAATSTGASAAISVTAKGASSPASSSPSSSPRRVIAFGTRCGMSLTRLTRLLAATPTAALFARSAFTIGRSRRTRLLPEQPQPLRLLPHHPRRR